MKTYIETYIENPKGSTRKLLELINEYIKVAGYKINTQKSLEFLYTNNERTEREIKEKIPFNTGTKRIKYLGISSVQLLSHVRLFATPWTVAHQASLPITNSWNLLKPMSI